MGKTALLFPGQGVQYVGMGKQIYESFSKAKGVFEEASDCCGFDVAKLCFEGNQEILGQTENTQPLVLTVGYAAARIVVEELGYKPIMAAGHSLGEFTALTSAGGIKFRDAVKLVKIRGRLMQEAVSAGTGAMSAVVGLEPYMVKQICEKITKEGFIVEVSNYNSPTQTVISGHQEAVAAAEESFLKLHAKTIRLSVSAPFHCSLMRPAVSRLEKELSKIQFYPLEFPVVSNVTGAPYRDEQKIKEMLVLQLTHPVEWTKTIRFMYLNGISDFIDVGPGDTAKNLAKANIHGIKTVSFDKEKM